MKKIFLFLLIIILFLLSGCSNYREKYDELSDQYFDLQVKYDELKSEYWKLEEKYQELYSKYENLSIGDE